jgi:hypothetical protein
LDCGGPETWREPVFSPGLSFCFTASRAVVLGTPHLPRRLAQPALPAAPVSRGVAACKPLARLLPKILKISGPHAHRNPHKFRRGLRDVRVRRNLAGKNARVDVGAVALEALDGVGGVVVARFNVGNIFIVANISLACTAAGSSCLSFPRLGASSKVKNSA